MINSFSERHKIIKSVNLNPNEMPEELRNRLWNTTNSYIDNFIREPNRNGVISCLWDRFFKEDIAALKNKDYFSGEYSIGQIKDKFYKFEWNKVYDFLEFLLSINNYSQKNIFIENLNLVFIDERVQYKIIDDIVTPLITKEEAEEVEKATDSKYSIVSKHIKKGLELYSKRPVADYQNSIKESISAIEALARIVLNKPNGTLGALVEQLNIHQAFKKGINHLYVWTSDEGGIRHSENGKELKIDEKEARYMLVQCSALVNYIISKHEN